MYNSYLVDQVMQLLLSSLVANVTGIVLRDIPSKTTLISAITERDSIRFIST